MKVTPLGIEGSWLIESPTYPDNRGLFREWYESDLTESFGLPRFVLKQANTSLSAKGVIRGIHYSQTNGGQAKIITCTSGSILDVVVDLRQESRTFGKSVIVELKSESGKSVFISSGLGHGFQALEEKTSVTYLLDKKYDPDAEFAIDPLDADLSITWARIPYVISAKDSSASSFLSMKRRESKE
jgi:dTDP-4-dehydrorhamnose 3,5-epimerase